LLETADPETWAEVVGQALQQTASIVARYGGEVSQVGEEGLVAHHWERAGDVERAVLYVWRAGEQVAAQWSAAIAVTFS